MYIYVYIYLFIYKHSTPVVNKGRNPSPALMLKPLSTPRMWRQCAQIPDSKVQVHTAAALGVFNNLILLHPNDREKRQ